MSTRSRIKQSRSEGTVPESYSVFAGTVPVAYSLFAGTVPPYNLFQDIILFQQFHDDKVGLYLQICVCIKTFLEI